MPSPHCRQWHALIAEKDGKGRWRIRRRHSSESSTSSISSRVRTAPGRRRGNLRMAFVGSESAARATFDLLVPCCTAFSANLSTNESDTLPQPFSHPELRDVGRESIILFQFRRSLLNSRPQHHEGLTVISDLVFHAFALDRCKSTPVISVPAHTRTPTSCITKKPPEGG